MQTGRRSGFNCKPPIYMQRSSPISSSSSRPARQRADCVGGGALLALPGEDRRGEAPTWGVHLPFCTPGSIARPSAPCMGRYLHLRGGLSRRQGRRRRGRLGSRSPTGAGLSAKAARWRPGCSHPGTRGGKGEEAPGGEGRGGEGEPGGSRGRHVGSPVFFFFLSFFFSPSGRPQAGNGPQKGRQTENDPSN